MAFDDSRDLDVSHRFSTDRALYAPWARAGIWGTTGTGAIPSESVTDYRQGCRFLTDLLWGGVPSVDVKVRNVSADDAWNDLERAARELLGMSAEGALAKVRQGDDLGDDVTDSTIRSLILLATAQRPASAA
jgi:hypothetical protein